MNTNVKIYGAVSIKEGNTKKEYVDNDIKQLVGKTAGAYGRHWTYAGDQGYEESCILIVAKEDHLTFVGRSGLNDALQHLQAYTQ